MEGRKQLLNYKRKGFFEVAVNGKFLNIKTTPHITGHFKHPYYNFQHMNHSFPTSINSFEGS
jgi:hypothetical protein